MNILKTIPAILLTMSMLTSCLGINNYDVEAHENADEDVTISYLGKGFGAGVAFYGDLFQIEADADFRYDVVVLTDAAYRSRYGSANALINMYTEGLVKLLEMKEMKLEDYLLKGTQTHGEQILPQGNYKVYVIGIGLDGTPTGDLYSKPFTVKSYLDCETDGKPQLMSDWKAEYLGRYVGTNGSGEPINIDRISSSGTGSAYYYHVFSAPGALKTDQELRNAFENGCGIDDLKGAKGLIEWYKLVAAQEDYRLGLNWLLAKGYKDEDTGFMDYTLTANGTYDVYTVELLLNGHITGRYGKTTIDIDGTPDLASISEVVKSGKRGINRTKLKMGL